MARSVIAVTPGDHMLFFFGFFVLYIAAAAIAPVVGRWLEPHR